MGMAKVIAAAGDQSDLDAAVRGFGDGDAVGFGEIPAAVEESAVDVEGDEPNGHSLLYRERPAFPACADGQVAKRIAKTLVLYFLRL